MSGSLVIQTTVTRNCFPVLIIFRGLKHQLGHVHSNQWPMFLQMFTSHLVALMTALGKGSIDTFSPPQGCLYFSHKKGALFAKLNHKLERKMNTKKQF